MFAENSSTKVLRVSPLQMRDGIQRPLDLLSCAQRMTTSRIGGPHALTAISVPVAHCTAIVAPRYRGIGVPEAGRSMFAISKNGSPLQ